MRELGRPMTMGLATVLLLVATSAPVYGAITQALYLFDEGVNLTLGDSSGNGLDGTISGATWTTGKFGGALEFNGSSDLVTVLDDPALRIAGSYTVEAWVYPVSHVFYGRILHKGANYELIGSDASNGKPVGTHKLSDLSGVWITSSTAIPLNTWTHVAYVFEQGVAARLYVNASVVASVGMGSGLGAWTDATNVEIGGRTSPARYFNGRIDELRISSGALAPEELGYQGTLVPEPATMMLLGLGGLALLRRRR